MVDFSLKLCEGITFTRAEKMCKYALSIQNCKIMNSNVDSNDIIINVLNVGSD